MESVRVAIKPEIELRKKVAEKLKSIYFKETPWSDCYRKLADGVNKAIKNGKYFFVTDDTLIVLNKICEYSHQDLKELVEMYEKK